MNCPDCDNPLTDDELCSYCGWLSDRLLAIHRQLFTDAATWVTPPEPVMVNLAPRTPRPGRDAKVIRQGVLKRC
jgi:hypothetical protein